MSTKEAETIVVRLLLDVLTAANHFAELAPNRPDLVASCQLRELAKSVDEASGQPDRLRPGYYVSRDLFKATLKKAIEVMES